MIADQINQDLLLSALLVATQEPIEHDLAFRYAPLIRFDAREPFLPLAVGYTIFRRDEPSPSFPRHVRLAPAGVPPASLAIEYAIWWDWDIQHLYELEHIWVYVHDGQVVRVEASWHGGYHDMGQGGPFEVIGGRPVIYSEPGKHAFAPSPRWFQERWRGRRRTVSGAQAGMGGVWVTSLFETALRRLRTPQNNTLVRTYLSTYAFEPSWDFSQVVSLTADQLVPWPALQSWIPPRVHWTLRRLQAQIHPAGYRFLRVGHRGASAHAPDNTAAAIRKAAELDADMVEIDVQMTADGHAVVAHDALLVDGEGQVYPVGGTSLDTLRRIDLGGGERLLTLDEALALCKAEGLLAYIEIKDGRAVPAVVEAVQEARILYSVIVGSFRPDWLAAIKTAAPLMHTSVLFSSVQVDPVLLAQSVGADYVHPCWERYEHPSRLLTPAWIERVREAGLGIVCWHEERPEEIAALRKLGVDAICSDMPERLE